MMFKICRIEFKVEDCWVGVFWRRGSRSVLPGHETLQGTMATLDVWVCLVPMFPLHLRWESSWVAISPAGDVAAVKP